MANGSSTVALIARIADQVLASNLFPTGSQTVAREKEKQSKKDPLSNQLWRMYTKAKDSLPNGSRVENLTWRMMAMTLKKDHTANDDGSNIALDIDSTRTDEDKDVDEPIKKLKDVALAESGFGYKHHHLHQQHQRGSMTDDDDDTLTTKKASPRDIAHSTKSSGSITIPTFISDDELLQYSNDLYNFPTNFHDNGIAPLTIIDTMTLDDVFNMYFSSPNSSDNSNNIFVINEPVKQPEPQNKPKTPFSTKHTGMTSPDSKNILASTAFYTHSTANESDQNTSKTNLPLAKEPRVEDNGGNKTSSARSNTKGNTRNNASVNGTTQCYHCSTKATPLWRRDPNGNPLCNACGLFLKLHGVVRPLSLKTDVIKKRNRGSNGTNNTTNVPVSSTLTHYIPEYSVATSPTSTASASNNSITTALTVTAPSRQSRSSQNKRQRRSFQKTRPIAAMTMPPAPSSSAVTATAYAPSFASTTLPATDNSCIQLSTPVPNLQEPSQNFLSMSLPNRTTTALPMTTANISTAANSAVNYVNLNNTLHSSYYNPNPIKFLTTTTTTTITTQQGEISSSSPPVLPPGLLHSSSSSSIASLNVCTSYTDTQFMPAAASRKE